MTEILHTQFLVLQIDNYLNWKNHINLMINRLSTCYAIKSMPYNSSTDTLKSIYFPIPIP